MSSFQHQAADLATNGAANGHEKAPSTGPMSRRDTVKDTPQSRSEAKKASILDKLTSLWTKTGIDRRTFMSMFKGALAPTISLALYQADAFAEYFTTLGYLVIIMTVLPVVIMPRAKFLQTMLINITFVCLGCAIALLAMFCAVKARVNSVGNLGPGTGGAGTSGTAAQGAATAQYNSSGSAVAGLWLFVLIYIISVVRGKNPAYTIPCIMWAVLANVSLAYAPQFSTMVQAEAFIQKILASFLTGFAVATGVSLLVFPLTSRQIVFKEMTGYLSAIRGAVKANLTYMHSLEETDMFAAQKTNTAGEKPPRSKEAQDVKQKMQGLAGLHSKLSTDLPFAKREIALGKLGPDDLQELFRLFRLVMIPTAGLSSMSDIFDRIAEEQGWDKSVDYSDATVEEARNEDEKMRIEAVNEWHELMKLLRQPFESITQTIDDGLLHVLLTLQLIPRPKCSDSDADIESSGAGLKPGDKGFTSIFDQQSRAFLESKKVMLRGWCHLHGIDLPENFFENTHRDNFEAPAWMQEGIHSVPHRRLRKQLFMCLYIEFLLLTISKRLHQLMVAADHFRDSGKLSKTRLVVPGYKRLRKWLLSLFVEREDTHGENDMNANDQNTTTVYLGDAYKKKKDPEHLPPQNAWEHLGDQLRNIAHFFASPASVFGFRCACATMTIAIVNYLHDTQTFFTTQRLFWAQIMVSIAMSPSAGQSLRGFFFRLFGTFLALIAAWLAYYIVDGHTAGVIVLFFVALHGGVYILLKYPQYTPIGMISQVTVSLIIGYQLQVQKLGIAVATSNGQAYYPIYELGPIRLATVAVGLFVAWIWTIFPYPISEHNQVRKNLGSALYLLANYYSVTHETVRLRLRGEMGNMALEDSPGRRLDKARNKLFGKANLAIQGLRAQSAFLKFDIPIGGKFPRKQYQAIVNQLQSILDFMSLISLASYSFTELRIEGEEQHGLQWLHSFEKLAGSAQFTSEQVTTLLSLMSAAIDNGQALPPYLKVPEPFSLAQKLDEMDKDILSVRHIAEPGYASFSTVQIGTRFIHDDLRKLVALVKELVGELDFSYHIVSTQDPARNESEVTLVYTKTNPEMRTKQD
ncbi:hypothetical protein CLAFUW4_02908 [Fulvia fulva]|uniref:ER transporter 6TM N-terminal domain-containing protein n=1 Tax=Passalora fulva TaxID=5499 RepID=A0A9Q8P574_PASFU|nr:uncharacterized protein CLAFUR5_02896 [Fulvia fulva]KAK4631867.1 hypothetical protein CLAFUR4_02901 [Fulvia fulva]KAK4633388.1 hypothetical protein CLAFUR0_02904 [Fulvia fulva]UJO13619.1 hypothetical protein CLAFUR5_02896 [Fulvia fulva]WPV10551.1 hypothetical protein CLAFUW4_02908 [Fulvia fulva]WPV26229.1 hypothetical protein CLAFUW7_02905 [Fulvia fulva]